MATASLKTKVIVLVLFAVAFGYLEAAIVIYLRSICQPIRAEVYPDQPPDGLFPVITLDQLTRRGTECARLLYIELGRELSTLMMLATVAWGACRSRREWVAMFALMFGVWDVFFYVFLRLLIGWPPSLWEWDLLFLLPVIWAGPVLAPVLVSAGLIVAGAWVLVREGTGRPYQAPLACWTGIIAGGAIVVVAFCWDWRNVAAGNMPHPFNWWLFGLGLLGGLASFARGARPGPAKNRHVDSSRRTGKNAGGKPPVTHH